MTTTSGVRSATILGSSVHHRDDQKIRGRLLNKLGIFLHGLEAVDPALHHHQSPPEKETSKRLEGKYVPTPPPSTPKVSTTDSDDASCQVVVLGDITNNKSSSSSLNNKPKYLSVLDLSKQYLEPLRLRDHNNPRKKMSVQFVPRVSVINVPSRKEYPRAVRKRLWTSFKELRMQGERNSLEFGADSFDWRHASEEDEFIAFKGELYHPETYKRQISARNSIIITTTSNRRHFENQDKASKRTKRSRRTLL